MPQKLDGGSPRERIDQRTGGRHRTHPVFCMWAQASRALWRNIRRVDCGTGGRGRTQEKVRSSTHLA